MKKAKNKTKQDTKLTESHVSLKVSSVHISKNKKLKYIWKVSIIRMNFLRMVKNRGVLKAFRSF